MVFAAARVRPGPQLQDLPRPERGRDAIDQRLRLGVAAKHNQRPRPENGNVDPAGIPAIDLIEQGQYQLRRPSGPDTEQEGSRA